MRIAYIFASRSRPEKFFNCLENIRAMSTTNDYFVWAKLDTDDLIMNNETVKERFKYYPELTVNWGISNSKIHAINRSLENLPPCEIMIIQSDDIVWDVYGFDNEIREAFKTHSLGLDSTIHWPDDHGQSHTIIVSILGINLYKKLDYLYHPDFDSVYADDYFTWLTKKMGKYFFINKRLFTHAHPIWRLTNWDELYKKNEAPEYYEKDKQTFEKLKSEYQ